MCKIEKQKPKSFPIRSISYKFDTFVVAMYSARFRKALFCMNLWTSLIPLLTFKQPPPPLVGSNSYCKHRLSALPLTGSTMRPICTDLSGIQASLLYHTYDDSLVINLKIIDQKLTKNAYVQTATENSLVSVIFVLFFLSLFHLLYSALFFVGHHINAFVIIIIIEKCLHAGKVY